MKRPEEIKKGLECFRAQSIDETQCSFCAYRRAEDCRASVARDAAEYIALIEPLAAMSKPRREGRIRTVYLYTITDQKEGVLCQDATIHEAAQALGYATHHGILWLYRKYEAGGDMHGLTITRRKGVVGNHREEERMPYFLYSATDKDGRLLLNNVNAKDIAAHYGLTAKGINSMFHAARKRGNGNMTVYHGDTIIRIKTERGARCEKNFRTSKKDVAEE